MVFVRRSFCARGISAASALIPRCTFGGGVRNVSSTPSRKRLPADASATEIFSAISARHASGQPPPWAWLYQRATSASSGDDAALVLTAHRSVRVRTEGIRTPHMSALSTRHAELPTGTPSMTPCPSPVRFSCTDTQPLTRAFEALAFHQEWERLQALHALLPTMAIDRVSTSRLHYKVSAIRGQNRTPT